MIAHHRIDSRTDVIWATPTSGYAHLADEQPLPYIYRNGFPLTPMFGGEGSQAECGCEVLGLPFGTLAQPWHVAQRIFNFPRRSINLYWRNIFKTRCRSDRKFYFYEQLDYETASAGYRGHCPLLQFDRYFEMTDGCIHIEDRTRFSENVGFSVFTCAVIPLFEDWGLGDLEPKSLKYHGGELRCTGVQRSAAGMAVVWTESMSDVEFVAGFELMRSYTYRF